MELSMGQGADHDSNLTRSPGSVTAEHSLKRQLRLRDLVLAQVLTVVGSSWVGIAAGVGRARFVVWLVAFVFFYAPMAIATYYLNRGMPLEGGLYEWARRAFGDGVGFMTAWNIWAYALSSIATILFQIPSEMAYMIGPAAAGLPENHMFVYTLQCGIVMLARGDRDAALVEMQRETTDFSQQAGLAIVYSALGRKADSDAALARMLKEQADGNAFEIAEVYAFRGQSDEAMHWLERAYAQKDAALDFLKVEFPQKSLAADSRFKAFLRKMHLPE
jgi:hypothetical protein